MTRGHHYRVRPPGETGTMTDLQAAGIRCLEASTPGFAPAQRRRVLVEAAYLLDTFRGPVAWRVKDFADGWIMCDSLAEARANAQGADNLIQEIYTRAVK